MKTTLKNFLVLLLSFSMVVGCNKNTLDDVNSADTTDHQVQLRNDLGTPLTPSEIPDEDIPYLPLFKNHLNDWTPGEEGFLESFYSPSDLIKLEEQENILNSIGLPNYAAGLVEEGVLSEPTMELMLFVHNKVENEDPSEFYLDDLMAEIEDDFGGFIPPSEVGEIDYLYVYAYKVTMDIIKDFENRAEGRSRGSCSFGDAILTVFNTILKGAKVGKDTASFIKVVTGKEVKIFDLTGQVLGGIIGGIVGLWKAIFKKSQCDCNEAAGIVRVVDSDCDLTNTLRANGTGEDASVWEWRITQGIVTSNFFTSVPQATVTQNSPTVPISATVRPVCEDAADFIPNVVFDFTDKFKPVRNLSLAATSGVEPLGPGAPSDYVKSSVGTTSAFVASAFADGSPITWEWSVNPSDAGTLTIVNNTQVRVTWLKNIIASVSAIATNTCGNNSKTKTMTIVVE